MIIEFAKTKATTYAISRDGQNLGTYSEDGLARQLINGVVVPTDLAFLDDL